MTTAAEVRGHLGRLWDPFTRGHFGRFGFAETAVVPVKPTKPKKAVARTAVGGTPSVARQALFWAPPAFEITERGLELFAEQVATFSETPELRTWASAVLSQAGRQGADLSTETALAKTILTAVQETSLPSSHPTAKALYVAAGLVAVGLPTAVVAHGEFRLTRALAAVQADGRWWYADPNGLHAFGEHAPFRKEKLVRVPVAADAQPKTDELSQYKKQVEEQQRQIQELQERLSQLQAQVTDAVQNVTTLSVSLSLETSAPTPPSNERLYKYVAVGALGLLAVTLYLLHRETKLARVLPEDREPAAKKRSQRHRRRTRPTR